MAESTAVAVQTVNPGEDIIFTAPLIQCLRGLVLHRNDTGSFLLRGAGPINRGYVGCGRNPVVTYDAAFGANAALAEGADIAPILIAFAIDGAVLAGTTMQLTPAAVGDFWNVSRETSVPIWLGCCQSLSVRNIGTTPIQVKNANLVIKR